MKVKYSQIAVGAVFLALLLDLSFFYIVPMPMMIRTYKMFWADLLGILAAVIILTKYKAATKKYLAFINKYSAVFLVSMLTLAIYTTIRYPQQKAISTVLAMQYFLLYFLVYGFIYIFATKGLDGFMATIHKIVILWEILLILNSLYFAATSRQLIQYYATDNIGVRDGIRVSMYVLAHVLLIYDFERVINKRSSAIKKNAAILNLILGTYCLIVVEQTRAQILAIFVAWLVIMLFNSSKKSTMILRIALLIAAYLLIFQSGYLPNIIASLTGSSETYGAYGQDLRLREIEYFLNCFRKNPLCGMGFVRYGGQYNTIVRGPAERYYANDVGIFGMLGNIGIFAVILYGTLLVRYFMNTWKMFQTSYEMRFFAAGLLAYIVATSPSLIMFWSTTAMLFPLSIAIFEYCREKGTEEKLVRMNG